MSMNITVGGSPIDENVAQAPSGGIPCGICNDENPTGYVVWIDDGDAVCQDCLIERCWWCGPCGVYYEDFWSVHLAHNQPGT